jgi:hypothetical protein
MPDRGYLGELVEGAEAAGEHDEAVGQFRHEGLALVHGRHPMQFVQIGRRAFGVHPVSENHANDPPAGRLGREPGRPWCRCRRRRRRR